MKKYLILILTIFVSFWINNTFGHCDTMDGPVIKAAQKAIESNDPSLVLLWVKEKDENYIKELFEKTIEKRKVDSNADNLFFEEIVRIHRQWEWEKYTWIKPHWTEIEPIVAITDKSIEQNNIDWTLKLLSSEVNEGITKKFNHLIELKNFPQNDLTKWREYVNSYVNLMHQLETIEKIAKSDMVEWHEENHLEHLTLNSSNEINHIIIILGTLTGLLTIIVIVMSYYTFVYMKR